MLAISSDIDRTTIERFRTIHRFLNTEVETESGRGVGLDIADSMWVFNRNRSDMSLLFAYDRGSSQPYADELAAYGHCGWIDTLHTYGNYSTAERVSEFERPHAEIALAELTSRELFVPVWVNHGNRMNIQNFGLEFQEGDLPSSHAYHTDLLLDYGVRFAWNHKQSDVPGVESPLAAMPLRDGRAVWGFSRWSQIEGPAATRAVESHRGTEHAARIPRVGRGGVAAAMLWWPELLDSQLASEFLDELITNSHYCVVAQHLGDLGRDETFSESTVEAFRGLRRYQDEGRILIARTSRLLEYARVSQFLQFETRGSPQQLYVDITAVADPVLGTFVPKLEQLRGVTFYVRDPMTTHLLLDGKPIRGAELLRSASDGIGPTIGVQWFKPDTTDYAAEYEARSA